MEQNLIILFDEYAGAYKAWDNCICTDDFGCKICIEDEGRMAEIIQEVETLVRKETLEGVSEYAKKEYLKIGVPSKAGDFLYEAIRNYAQSKGITL